MPQSSIWKPSVTVAALIEREGRFLLVEEETSDGLMLNQPAGHLDPGEGLVEACVREVLEETTHDFTPTALLGTYLARSRSRVSGEWVSYLRFAFRGTLGQAHAELCLDEGIVRTLWLSPEEIRASHARHRSPLVLQCVEDWLAGASYPLGLIHTHASVKELA